ETQARIALASGDPATAEAILRSHVASHEAAQPWYRLSASETLSRIFAARGRWREARDCVEKALAIAKENGITPFVTSLSLMRAYVALGLGENPRTVTMPLTFDGAVWSPSLIGSLYEVVGRAFVLSGYRSPGRVYLQRAARTLK